MKTTRERARARALRTARAVTLGLAIGGATSGCEVVIDQACEVFDDTRYCCERGYGSWNETAHRCDPPLPVPGPFVPPAERV